MQKKSLSVISVTLQSYHKGVREWSEIENATFQTQSSGSSSRSQVMFTFLNGNPPSLSLMPALIRPESCKQLGWASCVWPNWHPVQAHTEQLEETASHTAAPFSHAHLVDGALDLCRSVEGITECFSSDDKTTQQFKRPEHRGAQVYKHLHGARISLLDRIFTRILTHTSVCKETFNIEELFHKAQNSKLILIFSSAYS